MWAVRPIDQQLAEDAQAQVIAWMRDPTGFCTWWLAGYLRGMAFHNRMRVEMDGKAAYRLLGISNPRGAWLWIDPLEVKRPRRT